MTTHALSGTRAIVGYLNALFHEVGSASTGASDPYYTEADSTVTLLRLSVRTAPLGADLVVAFKAGSTTLGTLTIRAGSTATQTFAVAASVVAGTALTVTPSSVGSTPATGVVAQFVGTISSAQAAPVITPTSFSGLKVRLRADDLALTDATAVASWIDSASGWNYQQSDPTKQPTFRTLIAALNNRSVVRFDGSNDNLLSTLPSIPVGDKTVVAVFTGFVAADSYIFDSLTGRFIVGRNSGNMGYYDGAWKNASASTTAPQILSYQLSASGGGVIRRNGTQIGTGAFTAVGVGGAMTIGGHNNGGGSFALGADLAELDIYDSALATADLHALEQALGTYYGITVA